MDKATPTPATPIQVTLLKPAIWIESGIAGDWHIMVQYADDPPFEYAALFYRYGYTDNATIRRVATEIAVGIGASEPVEERQRPLRAEVERLAAQAAPTGLTDMGWVIDAATKGELAAYDQGSAECQQAVTKILDGKDTGAGTANPPWEPLRRRLIALVAQAPVVQATSDTARRLAAEFRGTVARKDFEAWGEEVLPLLDGMAAASVVQADDFDEDWIPLTDADRQRAFESMPNMLEGFLKTWGWLHFANAIEEICREKNAYRASSGAAQAAPFAKDSWQHAVDNQLVAFGRTSQEFTNPHEAIAWLAIMNMELGQSNVGAAQAVRMLTREELNDVALSEQVGWEPGEYVEAVQRKFAEVNGLRIPADGVIGGV